MEAIIQDLQSLENISSAPVEEQRADNRIRSNALHEVAFSMGARSGLAHRTKEINMELEKKADQLDMIFDFRRLLISSSPTGEGTGTYTILPPVITEANNVTIASDDLLRLADSVYKIEEQAKFVTVAPTWRDYLTKNFTGPEKPNGILLPRDKEEREMWKSWVREGWESGVQQANSIYEINLAKLERDIKGMIKYRTLLSMNMVSTPYVAEARLGVTGGGGEMAVDDRSLRITATPSLNSDHSEWKSNVGTTEVVGD